MNKFTMSYRLEQTKKKKHLKEQFDQYAASKVKINVQEDSMFKENLNEDIVNSLMPLGTIFFKNYLFLRIFFGANKNSLFFI
jgi:hypothetical protein